MAIEGLDTGEQLAIVSAGYEDLCACANSSLQDRQRTGGKLVLFNLSNLVLAVARQHRFGAHSRVWGTYVNSDRGLEMSSLRRISFVQLSDMFYNILEFSVHHDVCGRRFVSDLLSRDSYSALFDAKLHVRWCCLEQLRVVVDRTRAKCA